MKTEFEILGVKVSRLRWSLFYCIENLHCLTTGSMEVHYCVFHLSMLNFVKARLENWQPTVGERFLQYDSLVKQLAEEAVKQYEMSSIYKDIKRLFEEEYYFVPITESQFAESDYLAQCKTP